MLLGEHRCGICGQKISETAPHYQELCDACRAAGKLPAVDEAMRMGYDKRIEEGFALLGGED